MPFMAEFFAQTGQTIHLAVLSGTDVLYLEKLFGHESLRLQTAVGASAIATTPLTPSPIQSS